MVQDTKNEIMKNSTDKKDQSLTKVIDLQKSIKLT